MKPVTKWLALLGVIIILAGGAIPLISTWPKTSTESNALTPAANPTEFTDQVQSEENPPPPTTEPAQPNRLETPTLDQANRKPNRLISEKSPYLLQHAYNPVDWHPWGPEAFEKALRENKPIFLSIGYSTCHWCHVMEEESFEDPQVAQLLNETFVSIKVDREERPDIDSHFMTISVMMTGSGGWPLNLMLTPDQKPFYASTYIPKESRFGRVGMLELIPRVQTAWLKQDKDMLDTANQVAAAVQQAVDISTAGDLDLDETLLKAAYEDLANQFDAKNGGFGQTPKFPIPHNSLFLLRYWQRTGDEAALAMVEKTLQAMRQGGVYDQLGFGFHRYSTDAVWLVPHFEKMLYDQALLAMAYLEAYQATGKAQYAQTAREIFTYVLRDMTAPTGGFYSAEDADSEGEEGKFYLWTTDEIRQTLQPEDADLVMAAFGIIPAGNFNDSIQGKPVGTNILHLTKPLPELAADLELAEPELVARLDSAIQQLLAARQARPHPSKDDKILTDWNGLMIVALARGGQVLDEAQYTQAAKQAADFILDDMRDEHGRLWHRYRDGEAAVPANVDDYAFLTWGLLELYESDFEVQYLETALNLTDDMLTHFWDEQNGGFYFTPDDGEGLLARQKQIYDGAIPSGNSVAMLNLLRLSRITARTEFEEKATAIGQAFAGQIESHPSAYSQLMIGVDFGVGPSYEVVIVGDTKAADTQAMLAALRAKFVPNKVVLLRPPEEAPEITRVAEFTKYHVQLNHQATAYVCLNYYCELPTNDIDKMLELLDKR
jgi:hypothetical protein